MKKIILIILLLISIVNATTQDEYDSCTCSGEWFSVDGLVYNDSTGTNENYEPNPHNFYCTNEVSKGESGWWSVDEDPIFWRGGGITYTCIDNPTCDPETQINVDGVCTECPPNSHPVDEFTCACDPAFDLGADGCIPKTCDNPQDYINPDTGTCDPADCTAPMIPGPTYHTDAICILPPDDCTPPMIPNPTTGACYDPNDPNDPNKPDDGGGDDDDNETTDCNKPCVYPINLLGYPFKRLMTPAACSLSTGGFDHGTSSVCPCPEEVACYYDFDDDDDDPDDNNTNPDDDDPDDNNTNPDDGNGSIIDTTNIENKLDVIKNSISSFGNTNHLDMQSIGSLITSHSILNNTNLQNIDGSVKSMNTNLGSKLDGIGSKLDGIRNSMTGSGTSFSSTEITDSNIEVDEEKVSDIKEKVEDLTASVKNASDLMKDVKNEFTLFYNNAQDSFTSLKSDFSTYKNMFDNKPNVTVSSGGSCSALSFHAFGKTVNLADGMCSSLQILSPLFVFILTVSTQITLIMIAMYLFRKD